MAQANKKSKKEEDDETMNVHSLCHPYSSINSGLFRDHLSLLPTELLLSIFTLHPPLQNSDLYNLSLVSRRISSIARSCFNHYDFKIHHPGLPSWRLLRCLLDPTRSIDKIEEDDKEELGKGFTSLQIHWKDAPPRPKDPNGLSAYITRPYVCLWTWKDHEIDTIKRISQEHSFRPILSHKILGGAAAESLLPLLLYFTPGLEELDLGVLEGNNLWHTPKEGMWEIDDSWFMCFLTDLVSKSSSSFSPSSWKMINWPVGLKGLKKLKWTRPAGRESHPRVLTGHLWSVLYIPKLQVLDAGGVREGFLRYQRPLAEKLRRDIGIGFCSSLTRLKLPDCRIEAVELLHIAHATKYLKELLITGMITGEILNSDEEEVVRGLFRKNWEWVEARVRGLRERGFSDEEVNVELVVYEFLECNAELEAEMVQVKVFVDNLVAWPLEWDGMKGRVEKRRSRLWPQILSEPTALETLLDEVISQE